MNFTELVAELVARGAQDDDTRNGRWINMAYREIGNAFDWSFSEFESTGTAAAGSVAVSDLRKVIMVSDVSGGTNPGTRLRRISYPELLELYHVDDITKTGTPYFWWLDTVNSEIKAYPVGGTVYVRGFQRLAALSGTTDPVFDEEYHPMIVDRAMIEVYLDDDQFDAAAQLKQKYDADLGLMAQHYQAFAREPDYIEVTHSYDG